MLAARSPTLNMFSRINSTIYRYSHVRNQPSPLPPIFIKYIKTTNKPCLGNSTSVMTQYFYFTALYLKAYVIVKLFSKLLWKSVLKYSSNPVNYKKPQILLAGTTMNYFVQYQQSMEKHQLTMLIMRLNICHVNKFNHK